VRKREKETANPLMDVVALWGHAQSESSLCRELPHSVSTLPSPLLFPFSLICETTGGNGESYASFLPLFSSGGNVVSALSVQLTLPKTVADGDGSGDGSGDAEGEGERERLLFLRAPTRLFGGVFLSEGCERTFSLPASSPSSSSSSSSSSSQRRAGAPAFPPLLSAAVEM